SNYTTEPSRRFNFYDDDDYEESIIPLNEIVSQIPPEDSLIIGDQNLSTIPEKESDEFIKSSVEDLIPISSEYEDTFESDSESDLPSCNDFSPIPEEKSLTFSNPLFDSNEDFNSSDDESLSDEDIPKDNNIESKESYVSNLDEPALLVTPLFDANGDECFDPGGDFDEIDAFLDIDVPTDIKDGCHDSEGDIIYFESLLINDTFLNLPHEDCPDYEDSRARGFVHRSL
ncbi:hypothetical protein Tco_1342770, partial [Tanacetum coccineum]